MSDIDVAAVQKRWLTASHQGRLRGDLAWASASDVPILLAEIERLNAWGPDHVTDAERAALAEDNLSDARLQLDELRERLGDAGITIGKLSHLRAQLATRLAGVEAERDAAKYAAAQWRRIANLEQRRPLFRPGGRARFWVVFVLLFVVAGALWVWAVGGVR